MIITHTFVILRAELYCKQVCYCFSIDLEFSLLGPSLSLSLISQLFRMNAVYLLNIYICISHKSVWHMTHLKQFLQLLYVVFINY